MICISDSISVSVKSPYKNFVENDAFKPTRIGAFTLKKHRPEADIELLNFVFVQGDTEKVIVRSENHWCTKEMVQTLKPEGWLLGDIITLFADYLWLGQAKSKENCYFSTYCASKVVNYSGINKGDGEEFVESMRKLLGLRIFQKYMCGCISYFTFVSHYREITILAPTL